VERAPLKLERGLAGKRECGWSKIAQRLLAAQCAVPLRAGSEGGNSSAWSSDAPATR
jgi:hypothetical protein